jgi:Planctomycete cytochrome C
MIRSGGSLRGEREPDRMRDSAAVPAGLGGGPCQGAQGEKQWKDQVVGVRQFNGADIMSRIMRWRGLRRAGVLVLAGLWLVPVELPGLPSGFGLIRPAAAQYGPVPFPGGMGQDPGGVDPFGQVPGDDMDMPLPGRSRSKAARKKGASKKADPKATATAKTKGAGKADPGGLTFSQDIAPILVANCKGCHSKDQPGARKGKLDLTTYENLQKGTPDHKVIVPGKPEESHLVLRIKGEEEPKMPQGGNNRALSADAIAKITRWVKEGARLDAGLDPKAAMESYAASPEQVRRKQLAQVPAKQRDQKVIEAGQARWKQSGAKQKPEVVPGTHFIMFSNLPADRANSTLKALDAQYNHLSRLLGSAAMDWPEKVSLFVFSGNNEFVEFVRSVEARDVDSQEPRMSVRFNVPQPYIAAPDPAGGKREEPSRRRARGKKAEESEGAGADRSLLGLLIEGLGSGSVSVAGNAPRWLRDGIGLFMAAAAEPRSPYYQHLRQAAFKDFDQGWQTKATQALGGQLPVEDLRAVGFALVECMMRSEFNQDFSAFLHAMLEGGQEALDEVLKNVYNGTREEFLNLTGQWVASHYGRLQ